MSPDVLEHSIPAGSETSFSDTSFSDLRKLNNYRDPVCRDKRQTTVNH